MQRWLLFAAAYGDLTTRQVVPPAAAAPAPTFAPSGEIHVKVATAGHGEALPPKPADHKDVAGDALAMAKLARKRVEDLAKQIAAGAQAHADALQSDGNAPYLYVQAQAKTPRRLQLKASAVETASEVSRLLTAADELADHTYGNATNASNGTNGTANGTANATNETVQLPAPPSGNSATPPTGPSAVALSAAVNAQAALEAANAAKAMAEAAVEAAGKEPPKPAGPDPTIAEAMAVAEAAKAELDALKAQLAAGAQAHAAELGRVPQHPLELPPVAAMVPPPAVR